jgi:hypothetical protein
MVVLWGDGLALVVRGFFGKKSSASSAKKVPPQTT